MRYVAAVKLANGRIGYYWQLKMGQRPDIPVRNRPLGYDRDAAYALAVEMHKQYPKPRPDKAIRQFKVLDDLSRTRALTDRESRRLESLLKHIRRHYD